jgi:hypothetical protein
MPRAQAMQARIDQFPADFDETAGPHHRENDLTLRDEAGLTAPFDVELSDSSV